MAPVTFVEPCEPTDEELVAWANAPDVLCPVEDWDIIIEGPERAPLLLHLACDLTRPQRHACLEILYVHVGQGAREGWPARRVRPLRALLASVPDDAPADVRRWRDESFDLLDGRIAYDPDEWLARGPASRDAYDRKTAAYAAAYLRRRVTFAEAVGQLWSAALPEALELPLRAMKFLLDDIAEGVEPPSAIDDDEREALRGICEAVVRRFAD